MTTLQEIKDAVSLPIPLMITHENYRPIVIPEQLRYKLPEEDWCDYCSRLYHKSCARNGEDVKLTLHLGVYAQYPILNELRNKYPICFDGSLTANSHLVVQRITIKFDLPDWD